MQGRAPAGRTFASRATLVALLACAALVAPPAASAQVPPVDESERCDPIDPSVCLYPWPNDHFTRPDPSTATGRRVNLSPLSMPRNSAGKPIDPSDHNRADGFSPGQKIVTKVPGLESPEAFRNTGAVPITDIRRSFDSEQPVVVLNTRTGKRHLIWSEIDANPKDPKDVTLIIRPAVNFEEGTRYIVALRNLKDARGKQIRTQLPFKRYRDKIATDDAAFERRRPHMEGIFKTLAGAGIRRSGLYLAWDFTVASERSLSERMLHIRDDAFAQLGDTNLADLKVAGRAPDFSVDSVENYPDGPIARQVTGSFTVPCYLDKPACAPANSRFLLDPQTGLPVQLGAGTQAANTHKANFICRIPRWAMANGGVRRTRPSLYGHGLLGSAGEVDAGNISAMANEHGFTFCATDWAGFSTTDIPTVATAIADLSNFPALADRMQQGFLNFLYLGRLMIHPDGFNTDPAFQLDGGEGPKPVLDTRRLFYDGNSQGGIMGGGLTAVAPDYTQAVLGVPGMNYSTLLRRSVDFGTGKPPTPENPVPEYAYLVYTAYPNELERPLVLSMLQMLWDRGEANGYAHHMTTDPLPNTPPHEVLLHVAFGDHQVAPVTAEVEARTIGARALRKPMLDPGRHSDRRPFDFIPAFPSLPGEGSALVVWDSGSPTPPIENVPPFEGRDPHSDPRNEPRARVQKSLFLRGDSKVVDVCGGGPCYARGYTGPGG